MARAALRDDLFTLHRELTDDVLREAPAAGTLDERLGAWMDANRATLDRSLGIIDDIRAGGTYDLTTLPVALREVRALIQDTAPVAEALGVVAADVDAARRLPRPASSGRREALQAQHERLGDAQRVDLRLVGLLPREEVVDGAEPELQPALEVAVAQRRPCRGARRAG